MSTPTITEFLEARIAEDEREANVCLASPEHTTRRWVRVLAECAAKRAIIAQQDAALDTYAGARVLDHVLQALAAVYKDHPDYRQEWA
jgi:hypothetical protein